MTQANRVYIIYPNCVCHPVDFKDQGRAYSNLKLTRLVVLWIITAFVSDPGILYLLPVTRDWQANSLAWKYSEIFTVLDNWHKLLIMSLTIFWMWISDKSTFYSCYHCFSLSLLCMCVLINLATSLSIILVF